MKLSKSRLCNNWCRFMECSEHCFSVLIVKLSDVSVELVCDLIECSLLLCLKSFPLIDKHGFASHAAGLSFQIVLMSVSNSNITGIPFRLLLGENYAQSVPQRCSFCLQLSIRAKTALNSSHIPYHPQLLYLSKYSIIPVKSLYIYIYIHIYIYIYNTYFIVHNRHYGRD